MTVPAGQDSTYYFIHQENGSCTLVDSLLIRTSPAQVPTLAPDTTITQGTSISLAPLLSEDRDVTYQWAPADGLTCTDCANPEASPSATTTYALTVSSPSGCVNSDSISVEVVVPAPEAQVVVQLPNAFTPNNDQLNDVFFPVARAGITCQLLEIYNRWGVLVFKKTDFFPNDAALGWDGTYKGQLAQAGTYIYRLVAITDADKQQEYQGKLQLIH